MTPYPFALSLNTAIQVSAGADGYCLAPEGADTSPGVISSMVTLPSGSGMGDALAHLREGEWDREAFRALRTSLSALSSFSCSRPARGVYYPTPSALAPSSPSQRACTPQT